MRRESAFDPVLRALEQLRDPILLGVVWRSVLCSAGLFVTLAWVAERQAHQWLGVNVWIAGLLSGIGALFLAYLLFLPVAGLVATLFADRIATAVEGRFYPDLSWCRPAPLGAQLWDGIVLAAQVLLLQLAALLLSPLLGISLPLGWLVSAWAIGRGLFVAVAMRRMSRGAALTLYRARRAAVLFHGVLIAAAGLIPLFNLLVPVLGVAAMTHVLHGRMLRGRGVVADEVGMLGPLSRRRI